MLGARSCPSSAVLKFWPTSSSSGILTIPETRMASTLKLDITVFSSPFNPSKSTKGPATAEGLDFQIPPTTVYQEAHSPTWISNPVLLLQIFHSFHPQCLLSLGLLDVLQMGPKNENTYSPCLKWVTYRKTTSRRLSESKLSKPTQLKSEAPRVSEVCSLLRCPSPTRLGQWPVFQPRKNISAIGISIGFETDFSMESSNKKAGIFNKFNKTGMLNSNITWLVVVICPKQPVIWIGHPKWKWKTFRNLQTDHQSKLVQTHHPRIFSHFFHFFSNLHEGCWGPGWSHSRVLNVLMLQLLRIFLVNQRFTIFPYQTVYPLVMSK